MKTLDPGYFLDTLPIDSGGAALWSSWSCCYSRFNKPSSLSPSSHCKFSSPWLSWQPSTELVSVYSYLSYTGRSKTAHSTLAVVWWSDKVWVEEDNTILWCTGSAHVNAAQETVVPLWCWSTVGSCSACCLPDPSVLYCRVAPQPSVPRWYDSWAVCIFYCSDHDKLKNKLWLDLS